MFEAKKQSMQLNMLMRYYVIVIGGNTIYVIIVPHMYTCRAPQVVKVTNYTVLSNGYLIYVTYHCDQLI